MTGKTHKFLGIVTGASIAYFGMVTLNEPLYILAITSAPIGAMIADIDHNHSKLGSSRKQVVDTITMAISIIIPLAIIFFLLLGYLNKTLIMSLITLILVMIPFIVLFILTKINFVKNNLKFMTKHRGFLHTLILPIFIYTGIFMADEPVLSILLKGLLAGYISHLLADLLTVRGCPILFPLTKKNFRLSKIRTGSKWEYVGAAGISAGIICIALLQSM